MYAVFKGDPAQDARSGPRGPNAPKGPDAACPFSASSAAAAGATSAADASESGCVTDFQRFALQGATFGLCLATPDVSWAFITSPETGQRVHIALCGKIENVLEIADLYNIREEAEVPGDASSGAGNLCGSTSASAKLVLDLYWKGFSDAYGDYSAQPETCLASLEGSWSFCLYDEGSGYILAAQSPHTSTPCAATRLFWAHCPTTGDLSVTTGGLCDLLDRSTAAEFPAGGYFIKSLCNPEGELASFLPKALAAQVDMDQSGERDRDAAAMCGHVFRVASGSDIAGLQSGTDVQAQ